MFGHWWFGIFFSFSMLFVFAVFMCSDVMCRMGSGRFDYIVVIFFSLGFWTVSLCRLVWIQIPENRFTINQTIRELFHVNEFIRIQATQFRLPAASNNRRKQKKIFRIKWNVELKSHNECHVKFFFFLRYFELLSIRQIFVWNEWTEKKCNKNNILFVVLDRFWSVNFVEQWYLCWFYEWIGIGKVSNVSYFLLSVSFKLLRSSIVCAEHKWEDDEKKNNTNNRKKLFFFSSFWTGGSITVWVNRKEAPDKLYTLVLSATLLIFMDIYVLFVFVYSYFIFTKFN